MAITVYVENMNHKRIRMYHDAGGGLGELAELGKGTRTSLGAIYRHGDAMLNTPQLGWLLDELDVIGDGLTSAIQRGAADALRGAAEEAVRLGGYLYFDGD